MLFWKGTVVLDEFTSKNLRHTLDKLITDCDRRQSMVQQLISSSHRIQWVTQFWFESATAEIITLCFSSWLLFFITERMLMKRGTERQIMKWRSDITLKVLWKCSETDTDKGYLHVSMENLQFFVFSSQLLFFFGNFLFLSQL